MASPKLTYQYYIAESKEEARSLIAYFEQLGLRLDRKVRRDLMNDSDDILHLFFMIGGNFWDMDTGKRSYHDITELGEIIERANYWVDRK